jgi:hypothetical protein
MDFIIFEAFTAVSVHTVDFWILTPCSPVSGFECSEGMQTAFSFRLE